MLTERASPLTIARWAGTGSAGTSRPSTRTRLGRERQLPRAPAAWPGGWRAGCSARRSRRRPPRPAAQARACSRIVAPRAARAGARQTLGVVEPERVEAPRPAPQRRRPQAHTAPRVQPRRPRRRPDARRHSPRARSATSTRGAHRRGRVVGDDARGCAQPSAPETEGRGRPPDRRDAGLALGSRGRSLALAHSDALLTRSPPARLRSGPRPHAPSGGDGVAGCPRRESCAAPSSGSPCPCARAGSRAWRAVRGRA